MRQCLAPEGAWFSPKRIEQSAVGNILWTDALLSISQFLEKSYP